MQDKNGDRSRFKLVSVWEKRQREDGDGGFVLGGRLGMGEKADDEE